MIKPVIVRFERAFMLCEIGVHSLNAMHRGQLGLQDFNVEGSHQKAVTSGVDAFYQVLGSTQRCHENNRHKAAATASFDFARGFITVHHRHHDIHQYCIGVFQLEHCYAIRTITGGDYDIPKMLKHCPQGDAIGRVVFDNENFHDERFQP